MLLLSFNINNDKYVIDSRHVIEVTTLVKLKTLPGSIPGICGLLNYHGSAVPIIDINILCGRPEQQQTLTTRLIIVNYHRDNILGIKAENVTETIRIHEGDFKCSGIHINENRFLGDVAEIDSKFIQLININQLLSDDVMHCLFPENTKVAG